ncbi:MAG: leucine-rich repeat domain-containing protein [Clostridia bacterium]|nr:leucine-rich repeat domain-containing protein [Clostridia bacterium]
MKKKISYVAAFILMLCLAVCLGMSASAKDDLATTGQCGDNVYWTYDSLTGELVISGTGDMYDYRNFIDYSPFYDVDIKSIIVEVGITSIGDGMFEHCDSLEEVVIPDGVTRIGDRAFGSCTALSNVTIPYGVKSIGDGAFSSCYEFTNVTIPDSVTSIGINAFLACKNITNIVIPDSVINLGRGAFDRCSAATSITIGNNVRSIGGSTFNDCDKVESIYIPASVTGIESSAFSDWHSLKEIIVDENNENYISEQGILFNKDKTQLVKYPSSKEGTIYTVPESVEQFGDYEVFGHCKYLEEIVIGSKVTSLGDFMFQDCENLKNIELSDDLTTINLGSFWGCSNLKDIIIPDSVTIIEQNAFKGCSSLTLIEIPKNVASIEEEAFGRCITLENIFVDEQNDYYCDENGVLYSKDKSILVQYPAGKKDLNFTLNINTSVIGEYALAYNAYLETVELNRTLTEIKPNAFSNYSSNIYCYGEAYNWIEIFTNENNQLIVNANVLCYYFEDEVLIVSGITGNTNIKTTSYHPWSQYATLTKQILIKDIFSVESNAFSDFENLTTVIIDSDDTRILSGAFKNCANLNMVVSYANLYLNKNAVSSNKAPEHVFVEKSKNEYSNYTLFEFMSSADDEFALGEEKIGVYVDGTVEFTEEEFKVFVSAMYYGSYLNFYNIVFREFTPIGDYIFGFTSLYPLKGEYVPSADNTRIFAIIETDPENNGYEAFTLENFCDIMNNEELGNYNYKFAVYLKPEENKKEDEDNTDETENNGNVDDENESFEEAEEEEEGFFENVLNIISDGYASILEAVKKIIKIIARLFGK